MAKVRTCPKWLVSGISEAGYYVYTYEAGTSTPKDTYTDNTETVANTNPVILDSRGEEDIWWAGTYKVAVYTGDKDVDGILVWSVDDYGEGEEAHAEGHFNLVENGSFETDEIVTGEPDTWTIVDYSTGVHAIDATDQYHGLNSLKFTSVGDGGGYATSDFFEVQEAKEIYASWVMRSSVATVRNVVDIIWYTSAQTSISTTNIYDDSTTNPTSWTEQTGSGTPPATARYAQIRLYGCHSSDPTSGSTWFDNVSANDLTAKATQAEVDAGTEANKYVTPEKLDNWSGLNFRGASARLSGNVGIDTSTDTEIGFNAALYDTDDIHDPATNNTRFTVPTGVTKVRFTLQVKFNFNATGVRIIRLLKNGSSTFIPPLSHSDDTSTTTSITVNMTSSILEVVATDYFEVQVWQNSGGSLDVVSGDTWFAMEIIE